MLCCLLRQCLPSVLLLVVAAAGPPSPPKPWRQDRFVISAWVDPIVPPARYDAEYARMRSANISMLLGGFGAKSRADVILQVAAATKAGMTAVPSYCDGACANVSGAWGLQIADEPNVKAFASLAPKVAQVKASGKLAFVNLLPNYASSPGQTGAASYEDYVTQFVEVVKPNVLSTDHYPDFSEPVVAKRKQAYVYNMLILRAAAQKAGIPWWNFFNAMPFNRASMFDISESQLRWQIYSSLAIGAKGLLYFCWWTPDGADFLRGQAIMTPDCSATKPGEKCDISNQVPSQKFAAVQRINAKLSVLGGYLLKRRSSAVLQVAGNRTHSVPIEGHRNLTSINVRLIVVLMHHPANDLARGVAHLTWCGALFGCACMQGTNTGSTFSFLLGFFDSNRTFLLTNYDEQHPALATILATSPSTTFAPPSSPPSLNEVDGVTGAVRPAVDDAPFLPGLQIALLAGDARLFLFA